MSSSDIAQSNLPPNLPPSRSAEPAQPIEHVRAHHVEVSHPPTISQLAIRQILQEQQDSKATFTAKRADSAEMTLAEIDALFDAIYSTGVVTPDDSKKIDEFSAKCGKMDAKCSKIATRALKELKELTSTLSTIQPLEDQLQGCFDFISDAIYEQQFEGGSLHAAAAFSSGIDALQLLEANAQKELAGTPSRVAAEEVLEQAKTGVAVALEDWIEATVEGLRSQKEALLEAYPTAKQEVSQLLGSLLVEEKVAIRTLLEKAAELKGTLHGVNKQLRQAAAQLNEEVKTLSATLKEKHIPSDATLAYGSNAWKSLAEKHIPKPEVPETKEWSPLAKRVVFGVLQGMQLTAGQLRFNERLADIEQTRESALQPLKDEISLLKRELIRTSSKPPKDTCTLVELAHWQQEVNDRSYAIERMEHRIGVLMESAREVLSPNDQELEKFGKKHANNIRLQRLVDGLQLEGVKVPESKGIKSDAVSAFLHTHAPAIFDEWETLNVLYNSHSGSTHFLETTEANQRLETIAKMIEETFTSSATGDLLTPDVVEWLSKVEQNGDYLMVRSTGAEDSRKTANAGGNKSCPYVKPTKEAFCKAAGEVVASYFGYSSLQNRINAGDNPFAEELKLAVTAQELIGEPVGGKTTDPSQIPISLVLFTSEPLYVGNENFRAMRIGVNYGHGEAVVGGVEGIPSDTVTIVVSAARPDRLYVMYDNKLKEKRLAPLATEEGIALKTVSNPDSMRTKPALSSELISRLYALGVLSELFFGDKATDMEIVIKGDTIYPVQARPVNRQPANPTYVDRKKLTAVEPSPIVDTFRSDVIVPGKSDVIFINSLDELDVQPTLKQAEDAYAKDKHKAVVVSEPESANSHPVVNFSGLAVTCLLADTDKIKEISGKAAEGQTLLIDSQTGDGFLVKGTPEAYVSQGYAVHPASLTLSVSEADLRQSSLREAPQEIKDLLIAIRSAATQEAALKVFDELKQHPTLSSAKQRKEELETLIKKHQFVPKRVEKAIAVLDEIDRAMEGILEETEAAIRSTAPAERLNPLLRVKALDTLLVGRPAAAGTVGQYALMDVDFIYDDAMALIDYQKKFNHPVHFSGIYYSANTAVDPSSIQLWRSFIESLEPQVISGAFTKQQVKQLHEMIKALEKTGMLSEWFAFFFKGGGIEEVLATLPPSEKGLVDQTLKLTSEIQSFKGGINTFSDPATFDASFGRLKKLSEALSNKEIMETLKTASPIVRMMIQNTLLEGVDLYDSAIKAMKMGVWTQEEKVPIFKSMLAPYFGMLKSWAAELSPALTIPAHRMWPLHDYIHQMSSIFTNLPAKGAEQLYGSRDFSVNSAVFGAVTAFERHPPITDEDFFTLTHQNLIALISNLKNQLITTDLIKNSAVPEHFKQAFEVMENMSATDMYIRTGIKIKGKQVVLSYNVPLRNHSAKLTLKFDAQTGKYTLAPSFFGDARNRWGNILFVTLLLQAAGVRTLSSPFTANQQELEFEWNIENRDVLNEALVDFKQICVTTVDPIATFDSILARVPNRVSHSFDVIIKGVRDPRPFVQGAFTSILVDNLRAPGAYVTCQKVADALLKTLQDPDWRVRAHSFSLLGHVAIHADLLSNQKLKDELIAAAESSVFDPDIHVRRAAVNIFSSLVRRSMALDQSEIFVRAKMTDPNNEDIRLILPLLIELVSRDTLLDKALDVAKTAIRIEDARVQMTVFRLFTVIVNKGIGIEEALKSTAIGLKADDASVRLSVFDLLNELVQHQNAGFDEAISAAANGVFDGNLEVRLRAFTLFEWLVSHGKGFEEALQVAVKGSLYQDDAVRPVFFNFFASLVNQGKGFEEAIAAAVKGVHDENLVVKVLAFGLFDSLVKQERGFDEALKAAEEVCNYGAFDALRYEGYQLLTKLIDHGVGLNSALVAAKRGLRDYQKNVEQASYAILIKLVKRGMGVDEAVEAVNKGVIYNDIDIRKSAYELLTELVKQGKALEKAMSISVKEIHLLPDDIQMATVKLYLEIVRQGRGLDEAAALAVQAISEGDYIVRPIALELLKELINRGKALKEAKVAANYMMGSVWAGVTDAKLDALEIFEELLKNGKASEDAVVAAAIGMRGDKDVAERSYHLFKSIVDKENEWRETDVAALVQRFKYGDNEILEGLYLLLERMTVERPDSQLIQSLEAALSYRHQYLLWMQRMIAFRS